MLSRNGGVSFGRLSSICMSWLPFLFSFRSSSRVGFRMKHAQHHCTAFQDEAILLNTGVERLVAIWALPHDDRDSNKY